MQSNMAVVTEPPVDL